MRHFHFLLAAAFLAPGSHAAAACPDQPLPPAAESLGPVEAIRAITFAATPSLDFPGGAWVVRLQSFSRDDHRIEIVRLRRQMDCNRYDVEKSWTARISAEEFRGVGNAVVPLAMPDPETFWPATDVRRAPDEVGVDGTSVTVDLSTSAMKVSRQLHHGGRAGAPVSAVFHALVSRHLPAGEIPTPEWRNPR